MHREDSAFTAVSWGFVSRPDQNLRSFGQQSTPYHGGRFPGYVSRLVETFRRGLPDIGTPCRSEDASPLGSSCGRESTADENVPVPGPPLVESNCFMSCRCQAPTGRHANPKLAGWLG
jgi:hypothetical protein